MKLPQPVNRATSRSQGSRARTPIRRPFDSDPPPSWIFELPFFQRSRILISFAASLTVFVAVGGCATWKERSQELPEMVKSQTSRSARRHPESVLLRADFVTIQPPENQDEWDSVWQWVNEASLPPEARRMWASNGLRIGLVKDSMRVQEALERLSPGQDVVDRFMSHVEVSGDAEGLSRSVPMRLGKRYELPVRRQHNEEQTFLALLGDQLVGRTLAAPQPLFALTASPGRLDQSIRLNLRPEIQFGRLKQSFTPSRAGVRMDHRRESWPIEELEFAMQLGEGDSLLITPTRDPMGLGQSMLIQKDVDRNTNWTAVRITLDRLPDATERP